MLHTEPIGELPQLIQVATDHSFQIRMPFIKGMLHELDFKQLLPEAGGTYITDLWGVKHPIRDVDIVLTKSMFKGYGWLSENGIFWSFLRCCWKTRW